MKPIEFNSQNLFCLINAMPVGMLLTTQAGQIILSNTKIQNVMGYSESELLLLNVSDLVPDSLQEKHKDLVTEFNLSPSPRPMNTGALLTANRKNGAEVKVKIGLTPVTIDEVNYVLASLIEGENKVLKMDAYNDTLTGLPNRVLFNELSENLHNLAIRNKNSLGLMFVDLDNFKSVNDNYGHAVGDLLIVKVAETLSAQVRDTDILGRIGGDEFIICAYDIKNQEHLETMANKLLESVSSINEINGNPVAIGVSIGAISCKTPVVYSVDDLINKADAAMYKAKDLGKGMVISEEC